MQAIHLTKHTKVILAVLHHRCGTLLCCLAVVVWWYKTHFLVLLIAIGKSIHMGVVEEGLVTVTPWESLWEGRRHEWWGVVGLIMLG
ncbi:hypothetical protein E2C01_047613 [Portunus trituberculatus]|uniref:Uncharacterized protein n=1 Tax=Portunus trituberculatus TaxID=210409 RepID=A0A5B7G8E2_PORTR|nr:hypothetical protein [Portunus trituberculatus]